MTPTTTTDHEDIVRLELLDQQQTERLQQIEQLQQMMATLTLTINPSPHVTQAKRNYDQSRQGNILPLYF